MLAERNRAVLVGIGAVALAGLAAWVALRALRDAPVARSGGLEESFAWAAERFEDVRGACAVGALRAELAGLDGRALELRVRAGGAPLGVAPVRIGRDAEGRLRSEALEGEAGRLQLAPSVWADADPRGLELAVYLIDDGAGGRLGLAPRVAFDGDWEDLPARTAGVSGTLAGLPERTFLRADLGRVEQYPQTWSCSLGPDPAFEVELTLDVVAGP